MGGGIDFLASVAAGLAPMRKFGGGSTMPAGTLSSGRTGPVHGVIGQNFSSRRKLGRGRVGRKKRMTVASISRELSFLSTRIVTRYQSISKYDNNGCNSIPLCVTATNVPNGAVEREFPAGGMLQAFSDGTLATGDITGQVSGYSKIYFPYFVFNLTTCPFGKTGRPGNNEQAPGQVDGAMIPFYQLYKDTQTGYYGWRICQGMNNSTVVSTGDAMYMAGGPNLNTATSLASCQTNSVEYTNAAGGTTGPFINGSGNAVNRTPTWEHTYTKISALFTGAVQRPTTFRTGIISFQEEDMGPERKFYDCANASAGTVYQFDTNSEDKDIKNSITNFWDQYLNTKFNHPLLTIRRVSNRKMIKYHSFDKFTIGQDSKENQDENGLSMRKSYTVPSLGSLRGTLDAAYNLRVSNKVMDFNMQNQTVDAGTVENGVVTSGSGVGYGTVVLNTDRGPPHSIPPVPPATDPTIVYTGVNGVPGSKNITMLQGGAFFPTVAPSQTSSLFPHRKRDRWFFIESDYFMPSTIPGTGVTFPEDQGPPGSDAAYVMSCNIRAMQGGSGPVGNPGQNGVPYPDPPSFDFVIQSGYKLRNYPGNQA